MMTQEGDEFRLRFLTESIKCQVLDRMCLELADIMKIEANIVRGGHRKNGHYQSCTYT
jgi:hypothetical protein